MHANVVIAIGPDESLPAILSRIHQAGLGHNAFLVRPRRSSIQHQLQRSGIPTENMPARINDAPAALVINAAARARLAADITRSNGASASWIVAPDGSWNLVDDDLVRTAPAAFPQETPSADAASIVIPANAADARPDESPDI
jgi:hypothetical protein